MYALAMGEMWYRSFGSKKALRSPLKSYWWVCMPDPFSLAIGLGMKVA